MVQLCGDYLQQAYGDEAKGTLQRNKCTNMCLGVLQSLTNSKLTGLLLPLFKTYGLVGFIPISFKSLPGQTVLTSQTCSFRLQSSPSGPIQTIESLSYNHSFPLSLLSTDFLYQHLLLLLQQKVIKCCSYIFAHSFRLHNQATIPI